MFAKRMILLTFISLIPASAPAFAEDIGALTKANPCSVTGFHFSAGSNAATTMTMKNDGAWCWSTSNYTMHNQHMTAHYVSQAVAAKHGTVMIGDMPDFKVRVAYQPAKGFVGTDTFTIHYGVVESDISFTVTVQ